MANDIAIPKGLQVRFWVGSSEILPNVTLQLEEDLTISAQSSFSPLMKDSTSNQLMNAMASAMNRTMGRSISTNFKQTGFQVWEKTDPLNLNFSITLRTKFNSKNEVYDPSLKLLKLPLPREEEGSIGLVPPGPTIFDALNSNETEILATWGLPYRVRVGPIYLANVVIKNVTAQYPPQINEEGYFIRSNIRFEIDGVFTATQNEIDRFGYN